MAMLCPECMTAITMSGDAVVCPVCRTGYTVLFRRDQNPSPPSPPGAVVTPGTDGTGGDTTPAPGSPCASHPEVAAVASCAFCQQALCGVCAFPTTSEDGATLYVCPACAVATRGQAPAAAGVMCTAHPQVRATRRCMSCQTWMCSTCDFTFPGDFHLCPQCASNGTPRLSARRKTMIAWAVGLAIWGTLGIAVIFSGALAGFVRTEQDQAVLGGVLGFLVGLPTIVGGALGLACLDRRLGNPPVVWVAAIWNGVLLAIWVLLCVVGAMS